MELEKISIDKIRMYENNAKEHPGWQIEQIKKSIEMFGYNDPIAIDENNMIIEGHGRFLALKSLEYKEVNVIRLTGLTEEHKNAYSIVHNKLTMNTDFDIEKLKFAFNELQIADFDLSILGFENIEIEEIMSEESELLELDEDEENETDSKIRTRLICPCCNHIADKSEFKEVLDGEDT